MIIDCISDLHGNFPFLEGGDLLLIAGDITLSSKIGEYEKFYLWLSEQDYKKKIYIGGNHDNTLQDEAEDLFEAEKITGIANYLCDSCTEFERLKIWGTPWTKRFHGQNPRAMAFSMDREEDLAAKFDLIPKGIDILITHCPPFQMLDEVYDPINEEFRSCGSRALMKTIRRIRPKLHVYGHIHAGYGQFRPSIDLGLEKLLEGYPIYVNASHVTERYEPINGPIRIELP